MSKPAYDYGVFIGRFQPLHVGHTHIIDEALKQVDTLIVLIGSAGNARTIKNPFTFEERKHVIEQTYRHETAQRRIIVLPITDYQDDDKAWAEEVERLVGDQITYNLNARPGFNAEGILDQKVALAGYGKDASSFYLKMFPNWSSIQIEAQKGTLNSTDIRRAYFQSLPSIPVDVLPESTAIFLNNLRWSSIFADLVAEWAYYADYPKQYGKGPHITGDNIVLHRNQVLLVTRGKIPGKGKLAMPGGFRNPNERFWDCAVRELKEETQLDILAEPDVRCHDSYIVDTPFRSLRGDVNTYVVVHSLPHDFDRTKLKARDDAADLDFYDFRTLSPDQFFDDHWSIINGWLTANDL